jgi:hypothetical protein
MIVFKGNSENGFKELARVDFKGAAFHKIRLTPKDDEPLESMPEVNVLLLEVGDEFLQIQLSDSEATLLKMALESEGTWVFPESE